MAGSFEKKQITIAIALIRDDAGRILLQKRVDQLAAAADQKWEFPGGKVEHGEDPRETVKRECKEEIGCDIRLIGVLPSIQSNIWYRTDNVALHVLVICYEARITNGTPSSTDKKVGTVQWFSQDETKHLDTLQGIKEFIALSK